ncbi:MAG: DUF3619 family protein [Burkholderiales bacterium]|nr:DUF3619 family protein [Burkholderiales bacterium]
MKTYTAHIAQDSAADRFGLRVASRLSDSTRDLPYEITERLRAARVRALVERKRAASWLAPTVLAAGGGTAALGFDEDGISIWQRIGSVLPLLVLVAGLVLIYTVQADERASELAEIDTALLTDDLPPAAYSDPGFAQFLKLANGGTPGTP